MALFKLADFNPNYREEAFDGEEIKGLDVYAGKTDEKIGNIHDVLVDESGCFRYLVIDTGFWIFGKKILLPVGRCHVDTKAQRICAIGLSNKHQAENLPEYDDSMTVDYDYEERVRNVYRVPSVEASAQVEASGVEAVPTRAAISRPVSSQPTTAAYNRNTYTYEQEPVMYQMNEQEHQQLRLYEERLVASKRRQQTGEIAVGKRVETQTAQVSVPVEKERIIIQRKTPENTGIYVAPGEVDFHKTEVARMDVYEETANINKQPFVREEVDIKKEVERDTVDSTETIRREELEVDIKGNPAVNRSRKRPNKKR
ncbi:MULTISPECIES: DUF2382 domain-containing protein [unclassified Coleofasciculus]|uniref:DUF2382 domain-containing protein n=1 Tax=unclassified Coleofasciculus TaxID=2692782 RepID=UPI00187F9FAA|nr:MULTISPECIES: DUF2382 domain-containing protein [unclassified Coleofasciculus]MBE9126639.1 DUF2382 domain-containing protein [Coleofasciculus sp. LEGE 07081]MBE9152301.1 DUF2382 domain-containing protein [Coleofasciculus sp. LEGE 07092]